MKNIKFSKDELIFLNDLLDCYKDITLHFPFSHYRVYKNTYYKILSLKEKLGCDLYEKR